MTVFGTRPEAIKFAPVIRRLTERPGVSVVNIVSSQHTDLLRPLIEIFSIPVHADLDVMRPAQELNELLSRIVAALDRHLSETAPNLVMVQGDTTTAVAGALAAFNRRIPVAHIEAGLRSGHRDSPFPEEMNRRLISQLASLHFAATNANFENLMAEGVNPAEVVITGNPVVDALQHIRAKGRMSPALAEAIARSNGRKTIVVTAHRRENFGEPMRGYFEALRRFISASDDYSLIFPVHPNPSVQQLARSVFEGTPNANLIEPLDYPDFIHLLSQAWLIVSDSGGVQEEAPSLGKALLVLRRDTERPEAVTAGVARLVADGAALDAELAEAARPDSWIQRLAELPNPFGDGRAAFNIADATVRFLNRQAVSAARAPSERSRGQPEDASVSLEPRH